MKIASCVCFLSVKDTTRKPEFVAAKCDTHGNCRRQNWPPQSFDATKLVKAELDTMELAAAEFDATKLVTAELDTK
jgi:hypothetical protein